MVERLFKPMFESKRVRTTMMISLLVVLLILFIWYGSISPEPGKGRFPGNDELVEDYENYIGEKVEISGEVIETEPLKIEIESGDKTIELEITGLEEETEEGDRLTVFGTAAENRTIYVENALIRPLWRYVYMYGVSVVGATWIGFRVLGQWRFDREKFALEPRENPLTIREIIFRSKRGDEDG